MKQFILFVLCSVLILQVCFANDPSKDTIGINKIVANSSATLNPVLKRLTTNPILKIQVEIPSEIHEKSFYKIHAKMSLATFSIIQKIDVFVSSNDGFSTTNLIGTAIPKATSFDIPVALHVNSGISYIWLSATLKDDAPIDKKIEIHATQLLDSFKNEFFINEISNSFSKLSGMAIRKIGDDSVNTYRIPGIITTDKGTLIAVYDIRYTNGRDLPGNIDIGMSRSIDKGKSWQPMKVIMDMGEPQKENGIGDPCILFDPITKKIWVAALWSRGNHSIAGSGPGLSPDVSGQFMLVNSSDDGLSWTSPSNITSQVKNPDWKILFQGPGNGIAMQNGNLVFPAQFWDSLKMPYSTIIYSGDHGNSWKRAGSGAKSNTTECQVVETTAGVLMLNMRDNRGKFRSVAITDDLGSTWAEHSTSYKTLPDPVCQASLIKAKVKVKGVMRDVLFFSNDNSSVKRDSITIKASLDFGESWQTVNQVLIDSRNCFGYSSLTRIDENTIGLLYEGNREIYFVSIPVSDIIKQ